MPQPPPPQAVYCRAKPSSSGLGSAFGSGSGSTFGGFGAGNTFGSSAFGGTGTGTGSALGGSSTFGESTFGGTSTISAFGTPSFGPSTAPSAFGSSAPSRTSAFGSTMPAATSAFSLSTMLSVFGSSTVPPTTSAIGSTPTTTSVFGPTTSAPTSAVSTSAFGITSVGTGQLGQSAFGAPATGAPVSAVGSSSVPASVFGGGTNTTTTGERTPSASGAPLAFGQSSLVKPMSGFGAWASLVEHRQLLLLENVQVQGSLSLPAPHCHLPPHTSKAPVSGDFVMIQLMATTGFAGYPRVLALFWIALLLGIGTLNSVVQYSSNPRAHHPLPHAGPLLCMGSAMFMPPHHLFAHYLLHQSSSRWRTTHVGGYLFQGLSRNLVLEARSVAHLVSVETPAKKPKAKPIVNTRITRSVSHKKATNQVPSKSESETTLEKEPVKRLRHQCGKHNEDNASSDPSEYEAGGSNGLGSDDDDDLHQLDMTAVRDQLSAEHVHIALAFQSQSASWSQGHPVGMHTYNLAQERELPGPHTVAQLPSRNAEEGNHDGNEGSHDVENDDVENDDAENDDMENNGDAPYQRPHWEVEEDHQSSIVQPSSREGSVSNDDVEDYYVPPVSRSSLIWLKDQPLEFQDLLKTEGLDDLAYQLRTNFNISNKGAKVLHHRLGILCSKSKHVVSPIVGPYYGIDTKCPVDERRSHVLALINDGDYVYPRTLAGNIIKKEPYQHPCIIAGLQNYIFMSTRQKDALAVKHAKIFKSSYSRVTTVPLA
ncbi:hypothetical protein BDQ17DRAFT_1436658 [Cyathus striatus]|nr:hypothetical protein BDQ17DRAFT_1436658 [Cyathus striatus]